jgi:hypothetical protein
VSGWTECSMLWSGLLILIYVTCRMKCESLQSIGCFFLYPAFWLVPFPGFWLASRPEMATSDWSDFLAVDWLTMEHISILLPPDYILKKTAYSSRSTWLHSMCYSIFSFMCMFCRSLFVLCTFSFGHCVICSSSIYGFWLPLWLSSNSSSHPVFGGVRVAHLFSFPALWCAQCWQCFLIVLSGFYNVSLMTFSISENKNIKIFHRKHQF